MLGEALDGERLAELMDDSSWMLGRIKKPTAIQKHKIDGATTHDKFACGWKNSGRSTEFPKLNLCKRQYGTHWVLFAPRDDFVRVPPPSKLTSHIHTTHTFLLK